MPLSARTIGRIESLVSVAKMSPTEHAMFLRIVEDAVAEAVPASTSKALTIPGDWPADYREQFWAKYLNKKAKAHAMKALDKVAKAGKTAWADLIGGLDRYNISETVRNGYVKHPATWINAECWKDEEPAAGVAVNGGRIGTNRPGSFFDAATDMAGK